MKRVCCFLVMVFGLFNFHIAAKERGTFTRNMRINMMPLSLLDSNPRLRFGIEYQPDAHYSMSIDVGYGNWSGWSDNSLGNNYKLWEIRPELKLFVTNNGMSRVYFGCELFLIQMEDQFENGYYFPSNGEKNVYYDRARFHKIKGGFHFKGGVKLNLANRFDLDFYAGLGLAYRHRWYSQVELRDVKEDIYWDNDFLTGVRREGVCIMPHVALGVRIGLIFWDKSQQWKGKQLLNN